MSLFNVITWWTGQCPDADYDCSALCVSRFGSFEADSKRTEKDTIFVGSHQGYLSVYQPTEAHYETGNGSPTDLVLEQKLGLPILRLACGKFAMTKTDKYCVAVLHPQRLICYAIGFADGIAEHGKQFKLNQTFECQLPTWAFSMCAGGFGGVKSKEFLCVMGMDSSVRFFEQDGIETAGQLPSVRTIPSHIIYLPRVDCFAVIAMPEECLECYRYQDLVVSSENALRGPVWTFCVGEMVLDFSHHQLSHSESVIVLLGERNLICLTDTGLIKFIKKLDYTPISFYCFVIGYYFEPDARLMLAIASDMEYLFVYEFGATTNCKLTWSTRLPFTPVAMSRANFDGMPGGLVLLSETGKVDVSFFGTDPQAFQIPPLALAENAEDMKLELNKLEEEIQAGVDFTDVSFINAATNRDIQLSLRFRPTLTTSKYADGVVLSNDNVAKMATLHIKLSSKVLLDQLQILINPPEPLKAKENIFIAHNVEVDKELEFETFIYFYKCVDPAHLEVLVAVSFITRQGIPRVIERKVELPPEILFKTCPPQKDAKFKVTIKAATTKELSSLFPMFADGMSSPQALGLRSKYTEHQLTLVLAKNSNRFRLQSDHLSCLPSLLAALLSRLDKSTAQSLSINQTYFIDEFLAQMDRHSMQRAQVRTVDLAIEKKSRQMRLFQRKLFLKLQEDPPNPKFSSAAKLLRITHEEWKELNNKLLSNVDELKLSQIELGHHIQLMKLIMHHSSKLPHHIRDNLDATFVIPVNDWIEMTWDDILSPYLELLAHIGPLSKNKHSDFEDIKSFSQMPFDGDRFKKNWQHLLQRLTKIGDDDTAAEAQEGSDDRDRDETAESEVSDWLNQTAMSNDVIEEDEYQAINENVDD